MSLVGRKVKFKSINDIEHEKGSEREMDKAYYITGIFHQYITEFMFERLRVVAICEDEHGEVHTVYLRNLQFTDSYQ